MIYLFLIIYSTISGEDMHVNNKEMVMEHDVLIDEFTWLPFLKGVLNQAGFIEEKPTPVVKNNAVIKTVTDNNTSHIFKILLPKHVYKSVYKAISDCRKLRHSVKEIKPILSFLIHGGRHEAKLLAKKFSTKLPVKRCHAILTIYCVPSTHLSKRAPRARRVKPLLAG